MVNRLIEPTSGRILLDGVDVATRDVTELRRGHRLRDPADRAVPAPDDRRERRDRPPAARLAEGAPAGERAEELLELVGLDPARYAKRYPAQLSGGERQRVGVARALAADPPVMLMDEPFGAVDPIVRERLQNEFLRLQEQLAKTILFVTHDIDEAIKMGDLVAVFRDGGVVEQFATAGRDPRRARLGVRGPVRRRGPRPQAAVARPGSATWSWRRRPRRASARTPAAARDRRAARIRCPYLLLLDADDRPIGWVDDAGIPASRHARRRAWSAPRRRCSTAGRRSRTRSRCCSTPTSRRASSSTDAAPTAAS